MNERILELIRAVKQKQNYVTRDYKSVGGMWTVDTWKQGSVTVKVMDEGYTTVVCAPGLDVVLGYNGKEYVEFRLGDLSIVDQILKQFGAQDERTN